MLQLRRPTDTDQAAAVARAASAALVDVRPRRAAVREESIGWGIKRYERARNALLRFEQFNLPGTMIAPKARATQGLRLVVFARRLLLWTEAPVEVVSVAETDRSVSCTLRTLEGHPLVGEETFTIHRDLNGIVRCRIEAVARPAASWAWMIAPILPLIQRRFRRLAISHLRNATGVARSSVVR